MLRSLQVVFHFVGRLVLLPLTSALLIISLGRGVDSAGVRGTAGITCSPGNAVVIAADDQAAVYEQAARPRAERGMRQRSRLVFGCVRDHTRRVRLGLMGCVPSSVRVYCLDIDKEALAGPIVAYQASSKGVEGSTSFLQVRDLRDGRLVHKIREPVNPPGTTLTRIAGSARSIVVKRDGAVAWIVEGTGEVRALDKNGSRLVATYPEVLTAPDYQEVEPCCLTLRDSRLNWRQRGATYSATLN